MKPKNWTMPNNTIWPVYVSSIHYKFLSGNKNGTFGHISLGQTIENNAQLNALLYKHSVLSADEIKINDTLLTNTHS